MFFIRQGVVEVSPDLRQVSLVPGFEHAFQGTHVRQQSLHEDLQLAFVRA